MVAMPASITPAARRLDSHSWRPSLCAARCQPDTSFTGLALSPRHPPRLNGGNESHAVVKIHAGRVTFAAMSDPLLDAQNAYLENADYSTTGDATKAAAFEVACRKLMLLQHTQASKGGASGASQSIAVDQLANQLEAVQEWLVRHGDGQAANVHPDFTDYRTGGRW